MPLYAIARTPLTRKPRRITITVPDHVLSWIYQRSNEEGRSASNLAAYLLEQAMHQLQPQR